MTGVSLSGVSTTGMGGMAYAHSNAVGLTSFTLSNVQASSVLATVTGSIIHSEAPNVYFTATGSSTFQCHGAAYSQPSDFDLSVSQTGTYGGAFYIKDAPKFTSTGSTVKWCYLAPHGGAFYIQNSWLV